MSYTPTNWVTGDIVTADKLNKLENGVADGILILNTTFDSSADVVRLSATWKQIYDTIKAGTPIFIKEPRSDLYAGLILIYSAYKDGNDYVVETALGSSWDAESEEDYPYVPT